MNGPKDKAGASEEKTPFQKFQSLARRVVRVPKAEVDKKIREQRAKNKKK